MCRSQGGKHLWYSDTFAIPIRIIRNWCTSCGERNPVGDIGEWRFSAHAVDRALDMALSAEELRRAILSPEVTRPPTSKLPHQRVHAGGRIAVVLDVNDKEIVTILWRPNFKRGDDEEYWRDN